MSSKFLGQILSQWPDGLIVVEDNYVITEVSHKACEILGSTEEYYIGKNIHDVLCAQNRSSEHTIENCNIINAEINQIISSDWVKSDGHYISVDFRKLAINGTDNANFIISFQDNVERRHNQAELKKFTEYVEYSPSPLAEFDEHGQMLFGNQAMQEIILEYGFNDAGAANILPKGIIDICHDLIHRSDQHSHITEVHIKDSFYAWHFQLLTAEQTKSVIGYAFDISKQKAAEAVAEKQRNQARKEFFAKMVHELRTPLNAIVGFSDLLINKIAEKITERELERLKSIKNAGLQLNDLVTDTLDFSKIESGKMSLNVTEFSIASVCEQVNDQIVTLAQQKNLSYRYNSFTEQKICSDRVKVRQVLVNLLSNAVKYTMEGSVHLILSTTQDDSLGCCFEILVSDTGVGIPEEQLPTLFDSYEQVDSELTKDIQGTGLGLALVRDLITLLGGKVSVTSELGKGSAFTVLLPYITESP